MKTIRGLLCIFVLCFVMMGSSNVFAADEQNALQAILAAGKKMSGVNSFHMTTVATMSSAFLDDRISGKIDVESDILDEHHLQKDVVNFSINLAGITQDTFTTYEDLSGDKIITYTYANGKWEQESSKKSRTSKEDIAGFLKAVKSAKLVGENDNSLVYQVVIDEKFMKEAIMEDLDDISRLSKIKKLLEGIGDLKCTVTIDKQSGFINRLDLDLSNYILKIGNKYIDGLLKPGDERQFLESAIKTVKLQISFTFSKFNDVPDFTIPAEAKAVKAST